MVSGEPCYNVKLKKIQKVERPSMPFEGGVHFLEKWSSLLHNFMKFTWGDAFLILFSVHAYFKY